MKMMSFLFVLKCMTMAGVASGQVSVTGPQCVLADKEYQYNIFLGDAKAKTLEVCAVGGVIAGTRSGCYKGAPVTYVRVIWTSGSRSVEITLNTGSESSSLKATVADELLPGAIDTLFQLTKKAEFSRGKVIYCSAASGGNCAPAYQYQWEISTDNSWWRDIKGQNGQHLALERAVRGNYFVRRRVLEENGQTIGYSNACLVVVNEDEKAQ